METPKMSEMLAKRELTGKWLVTLLLLGGLGVGALYGWSLIVPWLLDVALNTTYLALLCAGVVALVYGTVKMRTLLIYAYASFVRWCTARFVDIDPIGMLNTYVSRLEDRKKEMDDAKGKLGGQVKGLAGVIEQNERERVQCMQRAEAAHTAAEATKDEERADEFRAAMSLASRQAKRLADSNKRLSMTRTQIEDLLKKVRKLSVGVDASIDDIKQNVEVVTREHRAITEGFKAFQAARRSLGAGPEKELYEMTLDRLTSDYNEKMGQIEEFLEDSKKLITGVELDNMIAEEEAVAEINAKAKGKVRVDEDASVPAVTSRVEDDAEADAAPDSFASLYKGKGKR